MGEIETLNGEQSNELKQMEGRREEEEARIIVVGYGRMGSTHIKNVATLPNAKLVYIFGHELEKGEEGEELAREYKATFVKDAKVQEEIMKNEKIDGVVIATPVNTHGEWIKKALENKLAVFVEKPCALEEDVIEACYKAANWPTMMTKENREIPLCVGYQRRFDKSIQKLKASLEKIGEIQTMRMISRDHPPPPHDFLDSAGSFFDDFSCHDLDLVSWIVNEQRKELGLKVVKPTIHALASQLTHKVYKEKNVDDTAVISLSYPEGTQVIIDNSRRTTYGYDIRMELLGAKGMLQLRNPSTTLVTMANEHGFNDDVHVFSFPQRFEQAFLSELKHFVNCVHRYKEGTYTSAAHLAPFPTFEEALTSTQLAAQAQKARETQFDASTAMVLNDDTKKALEAPPACLHTVKGTINVGIVGYGRMGRIRATSLKGMLGVNIVGVADVMLKGTHTSDQLPLFDLDALMADPSIHAIFVCTTSNTHTELIVKAASAGKHVFVEKPLALTYEDTLLAIQTAQKHNVYLYCGFHRRSDINFQRAKEALQQQGSSLEMIHISSRDAASMSDDDYLTSSGGFFFDSLIHDFDMARYYCTKDDMPLEVYTTGVAHVESLKAVNDIDTVTICLRFPSGVLVSIDNHRAAYHGYDQRLELVTSDGNITVNNQFPNAVQIGSTKGFVHDRPRSFEERYAPAYTDEAQHFMKLLSAQVDNVTPRSCYLDCLINALVAEAAQLSLKTGKSVHFPTFVQKKPSFVL